jgi:hypothetical protein
MREPSLNHGESIEPHSCRTAWREWPAAAPCVHAEVTDGPR